jgi:hypothetical protein
MSARGQATVDIGLRSIRGPARRDIPKRGVQASREPLLTCRIEQMRWNPRHKMTPIPSLDGGFRHMRVPDCHDLSHHRCDHSATGFHVQQMAQTFGISLRSRLSLH